MFRRLGTAAVMLAVCGLTTTAWGQVKLSLKYPENSQAVTHSQVKVKQTLTLAGMNLETANETFIAMTSKTGARAADGTLSTENKIDTLQANMSLPAGLSVQFDSGDPDKKADNALLEPLLEVFRATLKLPATVIRDKDNKIQKVEFPKAQYESLPEAVRKEFDPERRKLSAQQEESVLPDKELKKGETWERTAQQVLGGGQLMEYVNEYTYEGTVTEGGRTLHKISVKTREVKYSMDPSVESPLKVTSSELKPTESSGEILFDSEKGQSTKVHTKTRIQGDMAFDLNGMALPGKLDLTMEIETTLQP